MMEIFSRRLLILLAEAILILAVAALIALCVLSPSPDDEVVVNGEWVQITETEVNTGTNT